jgi:cytidylate kinase
MHGVVTISASYGARGDKVSRAVAERLGLPFYDRAIPTSAAARQLGLPSDVGESLDAHTPSFWERFAAGFANVATPAGPDVVSEVVPVTPEQFAADSKAELERIADTSGGVLLGRAGMVALGDREDVLRVRLDGPVEARIAQVVGLGLGIDEARARQGQRDVDHARESYARVFYGAHQDDSKLYHVMLDSTALSVETCVEIIVRAAQDRLGSAVG